MKFIFSSAILLICLAVCFAVESAGESTTTTTTTTPAPAPEGSETTGSGQKHSTTQVVHGGVKNPDSHHANRTDLGNAPGTNMAVSAKFTYMSLIAAVSSAFLFL